MGQVLQCSHTECSWAGQPCRPGTMARVKSARFETEGGKGWLLHESNGSAVSGGTSGGGVLCDHSR